MFSDPYAIDRIFPEVVAETKRARDLHAAHPIDDLPDGTGGGGYETWETIARNSCDRAYRENRLTLAHVFDEEAAEVLAETDPIKLRAELIQVMSVSARWIAKLDREADRG